MNWISVQLKNSNRIIDRHNLAVELNKFFGCNYVSFRFIWHLISFGYFSARRMHSLFISRFSFSLRLENSKSYVSTRDGNFFLLWWAVLWVSLINWAFLYTKYTMVTLGDRQLARVSVLRRSRLAAITEIRAFQVHFGWCVRRDHKPISVHIEFVPIGFRFLRSRAHAGGVWK